MYKLITILVAAIRIFLFLKTVFFGRSKAVKLAASDFRKQIDYLAWLILLAIGCGIVYSVREYRQYLRGRKSNRRDRTGWLGMKDSNWRMSVSKPAKGNGAHSIVEEYVSRCAV